MVEITYDGDWAVIRLPDDLDVAAVLDIRDAVEGLVRHGERDLRFDATHVRFMDSGGFALLIGAYKSARAAGRAMQVVGASEELRRLFNASGVGWLLPPPEAPEPAG